jgi:two-component system sensor histidine kinase QseC
MKSLRLRLLGWTIGGMALLLAAFGAAVYLLAERVATGQFDASLQASIQSLAALVKIEKGKVAMDLEDLDMPVSSRAKRPYYFELWDGRTVVSRSEALGSQDLPRLEGRAEEARCHPANLPDGRRGRIAVLEFTPRVESDEGESRREHGEKAPAASEFTPGVEPDEEESRHEHGEKASAASHPMVLALARDTHDMDEDLETLRWLLVGAGAGCILLMLGLAAIVVRQGLRPLDSLARQIAAVREDDLSARIPADPLPTEMKTVATRLNELLQRLEAAFRRERALTADVAHELRTPMAGILSTIEVALSRPRSPAEYQETLRDCREIARQTHGMTENLLALARFEGGQVTLRPEPVRLAELVETLWRPHAPQARARKITFEIDVPPDLACNTDREILAIVLANILANAAEYTNDGGRIGVAGRAQDDAVQLTFRNTGCTLTADEVAQVLDRFWRGDSARAATGTHCGLGLSLVDRAVRALGGSITVEAAGGLFVATVTLPAGQSTLE